jgi:hypothetical protein
MVDILDELESNSPPLAIQILAAGIDAYRIDAVEREAAHLLNHI